MSFQMIHMEIAYRLLKYMPQIENPAEFILASVAPDAVHMNPDYDVSMKVKSHMFQGCGTWGDTQDYQRWNCNIRDTFCAYMQTKQEQVYKDFVTGLCVHCLTDYWNDIKLWRKFQKENIPPMGSAEFKEAYYVEARGIDLWLYQHSENREAIFQMLAKADMMEIEGLVKQEELERQREHLLYKQYDVDKIDISNYHFLSASVIEDSIEMTVNAIAESILTWGKA